MEVPSLVCSFSNQELKNPVLGKYCEHEMSPLEESSLIEYVKQSLLTSNFSQGNSIPEEVYSIPCPICKKELLNKETRHLNYRRAEQWEKIMKEKKSQSPLNESIKKASEASNNTSKMETDEDEVIVTPTAHISIRNPVSSMLHNSPASGPLHVLPPTLVGSPLLQSPNLHIFQRDNGILTQECIYCRIPIEKSEIETHQAICSEEVVNCGYKGIQLIFLKEK